MSFGQQPRVEVSRIRFDDGQPPLDDIAQDFFETIFEEMNNNDVAVVPNFDRTRYYIVQVTNRYPETEEGNDGMLDRFGREGQLSFLNSPMTMVMRNDLVGPAVTEWERSICANTTCSRMLPFSR